MMWREPSAMRQLPWTDRVRLRIGDAPRTPLEVVAVEAYVDWLRGPGFLLRVVAAPASWFVGALLLGDLLLAIAGGMTAVLISLTMTMWARTRLERHLEAIQGL